MSRQRNFVHTGPKERGKRTIPLRALDQKFRDTATYLGVGTTSAALTKALGLGENTLTDAITAGGCTPELMKRIQLAMKERYNKVFDPNWPEWRDSDECPSKPSDKARDTAEQFLKKLREANNPKERRDAVDTPADRLPVAIDVGPHQKPVDSSAVGLVSVAIEGSQPGRGTLAVGITVACGIWQGATVQSGRASLNYAPAAMTPDSFRAWVGKTLTVKNTRPDGSQGRASLAFGGTRFAPYWRVAGIGGCIGTFWVDADFAGIENLVPGDKVTVTFGTWLSEIEETEAGAGANTLILVDDKGHGLDIPVADLSEKKRRVISSIRKAILGGGPDGYVELATHSLIVIAKK